MARSQSRLKPTTFGQTEVKVERRRAGDALDRHIGVRVARRRQELGMSSHDVGRALNLPVGQILDHEAGRIRIEPANLYRLAQMMRVSIAFFFKDDVSATLSAGDLRRANAIDRFRSGRTPHDINYDGSTTLLMLFDLLEKIPSAGVRSAIVEFVRSLGGQGAQSHFTPELKMPNDSIFVTLADASEANEITME